MKSETTKQCFFDGDFGANSENFICNSPVTGTLA